MTRLSVVIPAYNEENGIAEIMQRVLDIAPNLPAKGVADLELLVVDDGSADKTRAIVRSFEAKHDNVRLIEHAKNQGYGAALKTGFGAAKGDLIGFLDADGTYPPEYFPQLCAAALDGHELVIGSRMAGADSQMPITRRIGNLFFANLLSLLGRQRVTDSASGMRVFKRQILERIYPLPDGLNLTPVMSTRAIHEGVDIFETPIPYSERVGRSKLSVVRDGMLFLNSMLWTVMAYNPVRILGLLGLLGIAWALIVAVGIIGLRLTGTTILPPVGVFALFSGAIAGFTGFSLLTLGITFNYLVALFHKTPLRQGLFGKPLFKQPLDQHFGVAGVIGLIAGIAVGVVSLVLGMRGWETTRLWFYMLGSAMLTLISVQMILNWVLLRVLERLNERDALVSELLHAAAYTTDSQRPFSAESEAKTGPANALP